MKDKVIYQLGFKVDKIPKNLPIVDCRVIKNPFSRSLSDGEIIKKVYKDRHFRGLVEQGLELLRENDVIVVACLYGKHRSWAVADMVGREFYLESGIRVRRVRGDR